MTNIQVQRTRTGWDIAFGALLVLGGFIILGNTIFATVVSVLFVGWLTLISGIVGLVSSFFRVDKPHFWAAVISGGLLTALGLMLVRYPLAGALTLTLIAGAMFLVSGIARIMGAAELKAGRWILIGSGAISAVLGLIVLFNIWEATLTLLGTLLGIQVLLDGITILMTGRVRVTLDRTNATIDSGSR